ncbi:MAG: hypothetical protein RL732_276 [Bacteroidota bacterium]
MISELYDILPADRIRDKLIDRVSFASDAGFYYLIPQAVVQPCNEKEIASLFALSRQKKIPLVFRTGGTSLSGQSITDGILVDLSQHWSKTVVEEEGRLVRVQPGITGARVNGLLKKKGRKIGPDPSSISAAMMGGILSNNSSGMCCGVKWNAYHTLKQLRFMLPDGKLFSTEAAGERERFITECPQIADALQQIRGEILANTELYQKIRTKYQIKNTVGYSLNAFVDYEHPLDIMAHLLIGAEGTLAFISEAVLETLPDHPNKATALLYFGSIYDACQAIVPLTQAGAMMVELMDRASLRCIEHLDGIDPAIKDLPAQAAALLIEFQEESLEALQSRLDLFLADIARYALLNAPAFTSEPAQQDLLWKARKGLVPAVGAVRASGSTFILEDIAFPVELLGDAILALQELFLRYRYEQAIIFGHAKDGNIHFVIAQSFNQKEEIDRYDRFIREMVVVVVDKYQGTLKAEHGTGRNMAPFVEAEWGGDAYRIIKRIKAVIDPSGLLNPGVIVNENADAHIKDLKELPSVEEEVDRCIECGFCESVCPSHDLTTSPRRRIVARRELKRMEHSGNKREYAQLLKEYQYHALDTCAVDGLCATACPVDINTGDLVKRLRTENHSPLANAIALGTARFFPFIQFLLRSLLRMGYTVNSTLGKYTMSRVTRALRKIGPGIPQWSDQLLPPPGTSVLQRLSNQVAQADRPTVVYFASCISRLMGCYEGKDKNIFETFFSVCDKAGIGVVVPDQAGSLCCGQVFSSKGYGPAFRHMANKAISSLWKASQEGKFTIVIDVSSCAYTLHQLRPALGPENKVKFDRMRIVDSIDFLHEYVLPAAVVGNRKNKVALHPVCSLKKMGTESRFVAVARHFADTVTVPETAGCCGMAGDRGFLVPELTASATRAEAASLSGASYEGYYSSTKTCEMALSAAVKANYESVLYLADEVMIKK